jgi:hypothetical protein
MAVNCRTGPVMSVCSEIFGNFVRWCRFDQVVSDWCVGFFVGFSVEIVVDNYNAIRYS